MPSPPPPACTTRPTACVGVMTSGFQSMLTDKAFEDQGIPVGLLKVEYRVRAQISTGAASPWSNKVGFNFGVQGSPSTQVTAGSIVPVKAEDQKSAG